jgi:hypothetical protein
MLDSLSQTLDALLQLITRLGDLVVLGLAAAEAWLRAQLTLLGVAPQIQTVLLLALAFLLILSALRWFGGLIRVAVILVLLLFGFHALLPLIQH